MRYQVGGMSEIATDSFSGRPQTPLPDHLESALVLIAPSSVNLDSRDLLCQRCDDINGPDHLAVLSRKLRALDLPPGTFVSAALSACARVIRACKLAGVCKLSVAKVVP